MHDLAFFSSGNHTLPRNPTYLTTDLTSSMKPPGLKNLQLRIWKKMVKKRKKKEYKSAHKTFCVVLLWNISHKIFSKLTFQKNWGSNKLWSDKKKKKIIKTLKNGYLSIFLCIAIFLNTKTALFIYIACVFFMTKGKENIFSKSFSIFYSIFFFQFFLPFLSTFF